MENLQGKLFQTAVHNELQRWHTLIKTTDSVKDWKQAITQYQSTAYPETPTFAPVVFQWNGHTVRKQKVGHTVNFWIGRWHRTELVAADVGENGYFYTVEDVGKGAEEFELTLWKWMGSRPRKAWTRHPVGPTVVLHGEYLYYCGVENRLRYPDVWCTDLATGKNSVRIFEEPDKRFQVSVLKRSGTVFVHTANALDQRLGIASPTGVSWLVKERSTLIPLGPRAWATNTGFMVDGQTIEFKKGYFLEDGACVGDAYLFVLVKDGQDSLWLWKKEWHPLLVPSSVLSHIQLLHEPTESPRILVQTPNTPDSVWEVARGSLHKLISYPEPLRLPYSHRGTIPNGSLHIPYMWVSAVPKPRGLIVEGYGAYGISSRRSYPLRWLAYLAAGWAFAYVCPRGGREGGDAWYDGGRTAQRKHHTFEDTAVAIHHIQKELGIGAEKTVFFGRSAGGWLAARIAQDHGTDLVAAVYTEVPYVDVLRTTATPSLPLTIMEYDEFGNGNKAADVAVLRKISPVDTVEPADGQTPLVIIRTALHDSQVYPYESLKWAKKLREAGWNQVYVGIDEDGGHFARHDVMLAQRAEDAAILATALDIPLPSQSRRVLKPRKTVRKRSTKESRRSGKTGNRTRRLR
jgi:pimeloyl-ACP methyl ester carboxylesterase